MLLLQAQDAAYFWVTESGFAWILLWTYRTESAVVFYLFNTSYPLK